MSKRKTMAEKLLEDFNKSDINKGLNKSATIVLNINSESTPITKNRTISQDTNGTLKEQDSNRSVTSLGQDNNSIISTQDQVDNISITSKEHQQDINGTLKEQDSNRSITDKKLLTNSSLADKKHDITRSGTVSGQIVSDMFITPPDCIELTDLQMKVYSWFMNNGITGYFNKVKISEDTGIAHNTIRKIIEKFINLRLIYFGKYNDGVRLAPYKINDEKKAITGIVTGYGRDSNRIGSNSPLICSSSFLYKNTTTTELPKDDQLAVQKLLNHPEMKFWKEQGTTAKQILNGVQTTGTTLDNFIQSMKHYAHEKPASEKAPMAHMIGGIKRYGIWAKKPDYKSHEEKQAEIQAQIITERAQELQRLKEIREKAAKVEKDLEFEHFMADRDAGLYQEIFQSLTDFEKKRVAMGKDDAMRRAWEKRMEL